jgi:hypothetical protein
MWAYAADDLRIGCANGRHLAPHPRIARVDVRMVLLRRASIRLVDGLEEVECPRIMSTDLDDLRLLATFGEAVPLAVPGVY